MARHEQDCQFDVFLSYSNDLKDEVKKLYRKLTAYGLNVWLDLMVVRDQKSVSSQRLSEILTGINVSRIFLCCITHKYAQDKDCESELSVAYDANKKIIVLMYEDAKLSDLKGVGFKISRLSRINVFGEHYFSSLKLNSRSSKFDELIQTIGEELGRKLSFDQSVLKKDESGGYFDLASDLGLHGVVKMAKLPIKPLGIDKLGKLLH